MKFLKLFIIAFFIGAFFFIENSKALAALNPYRSLCVGIQGRFYANSTWKDREIQVGCAGDDGGSAPNRSQACTGEVQTVSPGEVFRLTTCSCFGSDKGCLKVGKKLTLLPLNSDGKKLIRIDQTVQETAAFKNNSCTMKLNGILITGGGSNKVCGSNGQHITGNIKITCQVPVKTPTPTLPPGTTPTSCPTPGKVTNVRITCPNCGSNSTSNLTPTLTPTITPTVTPTPAQQSN